MGAPDEESTNAHNVVLVVDDDVAVLSALRLLLEPKGFKVIVAANPFAAVKLAVSEEPDVIVMDLDMPGMDGMEAARHLKHINQTCRIPVIAYTGRDWSPSEYLRGGFERIIQKASGFDTLESQLEELLRGPVSSGLQGGAGRSDVLL